MVNPKLIVFNGNEGGDNMFGNVGECDRLRIFKFVDGDFIAITVVDVTSLRQRNEIGKFNRRFTVGVCYPPEARRDTDDNGADEHRSSDDDDAEAHNPATAFHTASVTFPRYRVES